MRGLHLLSGNYLLVLLYFTVADFDIRNVRVRTPTTCLPKPNIVFNSFMATILSTHRYRVRCLRLDLDRQM